MAANWDEACYPEPGRIDIDRQGPPHLAFGYGPHHCVAPRLAQMEAELLLTALVERLPDLRLAVEPGEVVWQKDVLIRRVSIGGGVVWRPRRFGVLRRVLRDGDGDHAGPVWGRAIGSGA
jgi:cytochrome P450